MAIVLVDRDGKDSRKSTLISYIEDLPATVVLGVAREEFEAWMLADEQAIADALGTQLEKTTSPENMPRGKAKEKLRNWIGQQESLKDKQPEVRRKIAENCNLEVIRDRCMSFATFLSDLENYGAPA